MCRLECACGCYCYQMWKLDGVMVANCSHCNGHALGMGKLPEATSHLLLSHNDIKALCSPSISSLLYTHYPYQYHRNMQVLDLS